LIDGRAAVMLSRSKLLGPPTTLLPGDLLHKHEF
jgi:hypothetical protein